MYKAEKPASIEAGFSALYTLAFSGTGEVAERL
jgi:hypothetical protein